VKRKKEVTKCTNLNIQHKLLAKHIITKNKEHRERKACLCTGVWGHWGKHMER